MKRTWANLTVALSQPWVTWVLFGFAVAVYGLLVLKEFYNDGFASYTSGGFFVLVFPFGGLLLGRHGLEDTAAKPFTFLLPGYRESLRKLSFSRAVRWGVAFFLYEFSDCWRDLLLSWDIRQIYSNVSAGLVPPGAIPTPPTTLGMSLCLVGGLLGGMAVCLLWTCGSLVHFRRKWLGVCSWHLGLPCPCFS